MDAQIRRLSLTYISIERALVTLRVWSPGRNGIGFFAHVFARVEGCEACQSGGKTRPSRFRPELRFVSSVRLGQLPNVCLGQRCGR